MFIPMKLSLVTLIGCCLTTAACWSQTVAYTDAHIETLGPRGRIENASLIVREGKIVDIGAEATIPDDARVVSLAGKTIMPGLIDPYFVFQTNAEDTSRTVTFNGRTFTIPGSATFTVGSYLQIGEYFYPYKFDFQPAIRTGITSAHLVSDGRGLSALANVTKEKSPEMLFQPAGFLFAKVTNQTSALDVLRKPLTPPGNAANARGGRPRGSTGGATPAAGDSEATRKLWEAVREGKSPVFVNVNNEAAVAYVLQIVKKYDKVKLMLVATGPNLYQSLDEIKANPNVTVVLQPGIDTVPYTNDLMNVSQMLAEREIPFAISMSLDDSQLRASQDDPMFPLAMLVRSGLDRETALKSVTIQPARLLGIEKTHGSLEKEKQANFLVFDGDPLQTGTRLEQVILNGNKIYEN